MEGRPLRVGIIPCAAMLSMVGFVTRPVIEQFNSVYPFTVYNKRCFMGLIIMGSFGYKVGWMRGRPLRVRITPRAAMLSIVGFVTQPVTEQFNL